MSVFRHKGGNIFYAGFSVRGQYFVRSLGTSNRREAERAETKLRALAEAGRLPLKVSAEDRALSITKSLANRQVARKHSAGVKAAARERKDDPAAQDAWIESIKVGQSDPAVKSKMDEANRKTAADPAVRKKHRRLQKKVWKRRGHKQRVGRSMTSKWATQEFRKKNLDGRDLAAAERLKKRGFSIEQAHSSDRAGAPAPVKTRRSREPMPQDLTEPFRIGAMVDRKIGSGPLTRTAIVSARFAVAAETHLQFDTVKKYHLAYQRETRAVRDRGLTGDEIVKLSPVPGTS